MPHKFLKEDTTDDTMSNNNYEALIQFRQRPYNLVHSKKITNTRTMSLIHRNEKVNDKNINTKNTTHRTEEG